MFKRRVLFLIAFALAFALVPGLAWAGENSFFKGLGKEIQEKEYSTQEEIRHVRIAGVDMWIPDNYLLGGISQRGVEQQDILLQVLLPDLEPKTKENIDFFNKGLGWGRRARILLTDITDSTNLSQRFKIAIDNVYPKHIESSDVFGLESMIISSFDESKTIERSRHIFQRKLFFSRRSEGIERYIICSYLAPNPGCEQVFMYKNMLVKLSYQMDYLEDWQELEGKILSLLMQFENEPQKGEPL